MTAWLAVAFGLLPGWAIARRRDLRGARAVAETILWGVLVTTGWMALLDLLGVRWSPVVLAIPPVAGIVVGASARGRARASWRRPSAWLWVATAAASLRAALLAFTPAFGWDFRYSWAIKAKVYALAGRHDFSWLAWPGHAFARVDYPPLWSDLLALGAVFGAQPGATAAAWEAVLAIGLAAGCWTIAAPAQPPVRALAAAAGAWAPVMFTASVAYSGYAEPMLAFAVCMTMGALLETATGAADSWPVAAAGAAVAVLTKNEGMAVGLGVAVGSLRFGGRRGLAVSAAVLSAVAAWRVPLAIHGIEGFRNVFAPARVLSRLAQLPGSLSEIATPALVLLTGALLLASAGLAGRRYWSVRTALIVWGCAVLTAYLLSPFELAWHLRTSLDRVLAVPLPFTVAAALGRTRPRPDAAEPRGPGTTPGG